MFQEVSFMDIVKKAGAIHLYFLLFSVKIVILLE
jgi:hypothetical protein